jgi:uncharacterized phage protein (TIGR02220 family)
MSQDTSTIDFINKIKNYEQKYNNPTNHKEISKQIRECRTIGDVKTLVDKTFPEWFITMLDQYSNDYPDLTTNWNNCCKRANVSPTQIMIVEEIEQGDDNTLIREFTECFSAVGFQVRRQMELIPCSVCFKALPSQMLYDYMKDKNITVPDQWNSKCTTC